MNKKQHSFNTNFDDLQTRIVNLKSVENLKKAFKRDSITNKKQTPTYLLPEFEIILGNSLAFTIRMAVIGSLCMEHKNLTNVLYKTSLYQIY